MPSHRDGSFIYYFSMHTSNFKDKVKTKNDALSRIWTIDPWSGKQWRRPPYNVAPTLNPFYVNYKQTASWNLLWLPSLLKKMFSGLTPPPGVNLSQLLHPTPKFLTYFSGQEVGHRGQKLSATNKKSRVCDKILTIPTILKEQNKNLQYNMVK